MNEGREKYKEYTEYDTISLADLGKKRFEELVRFAYNYNRTKAKEQEAIKIGKNDSYINFQSHVGVIQLSDGFVIEILPKISFSGNKEDNKEWALRLLFDMLGSLEKFRNLTFNSVSLSSSKLSLTDIFIHIYLREAKKLVKRGLKSNYVRQEDNLNAFKGKLLTAQQMRLNLVHKERFYVEYDEFSLNTPENRIIKSTLEKLRKCTANAENVRDIRQLLMNFDMVELSYNYKSDFAKITADRNNKDYEDIIHWSKIFLGGESLNLLHGTTAAWSLLYPMYDLFEKYVAKYVKSVFGNDGWNVSAQDTGKYLFKKSENGLFGLRPDIVLKDGERTVILDTKWKELDTNNLPKIEDTEKYESIQKDMCQMHAYAGGYGSDEVWLLYPAINDTNNTDIAFNIGGKCVRVYFINLLDLQSGKFKIRESIENFKDSTINSKAANGRNFNLIKYDKIVPTTTEGRMIIIKDKPLLSEKYGSNYGITRDEMYYMYAYAKTNNAKELWLLSPEPNKPENEEIELKAEAGDLTVRLYYYTINL